MTGTLARGTHPTAPVSAKTEALMEATARLQRIARLLEQYWEVDASVMVRGIANQIADMAAERRQMDNARESSE